MELLTERLILRRWREADRDAFAAINADPLVNEYLPGPLSREESDALLDRIETHFETHGFGLWAVELNETGELAGFTGLARPRFEAFFTPCVEIGWRLGAQFWGNGYAPEAARKALQYGFETVGLEETISMTVPDNHRSRRVMEKLGMRYCPEEDFEHPVLPEGDPLRPHVLYRLSREEFESLTK